MAAATPLADPSNVPERGLWADKYRPQTVNQMCYPVSANKLKAWMMSFDAQNPKQVRGALLSGPPGVGKTTSVYLVAKELGRSVIEYNASDFRSKKSLHDYVSAVINNRVFSDNGATRQQEATRVQNRFVLLMDEVDGCDLGGVSEVIQMIKGTKVPIVCTCNDRWHLKLRPLINHVEDIRFSRPPCNIVANFICERILARERVSLSKQLLQDIIKNCGSDIRNVLNNLQVWCLKRNVLDQQTLASAAASSGKNADVGLFEVPEHFLMQGSSSHGAKGVGELLSAYYNADLVDLFVQENYLSYQPDGREWLGAAADAAASISAADMFQRVMYQEQNWSVSNGYILKSAVIPCALVRGHYQSFRVGQQAFFDRQRPIKFPSWLGNNSTTGKNQRLLTILTKQATHPTTGMSGTTLDVALDYIPLALVGSLSRPLVELGKDGIPAVVAAMDAYRLLRDDWDFVRDIVAFKLKESTTSPASAGAAAGGDIPTLVKSAFTREFNKSHKTAGMRSVLGNLGASQSEPLPGDDEEESESPKDGEPIDDSAVVVAPPRAAAAKKAPARRSAAATGGPAAAPASRGGKKAPPSKRPRDLTFIDDDDS